jgi:hypothetical protein
MGLKLITTISKVKFIVLLLTSIVCASESYSEAQLFGGGKKHSFIANPELRFSNLRSLMNSIVGVDIWGSIYLRGKKANVISVYSPNGSFKNIKIEGGRIAVVNVNMFGGFAINIRDTNGDRATHFYNRDQELINDEPLHGYTSLGVVPGQYMFDDKIGFSVYGELLDSTEVEAQKEITTFGSVLIPFSHSTDSVVTLTGSIYDINYQSIVEIDYCNGKEKRFNLGLDNEIFPDVESQKKCIEYGIDYYVEAVVRYDKNPYISPNGGIYVAKETEDSLMVVKWTYSTGDSIPQLQLPKFSTEGCELKWAEPVVDSLSIKNVEIYRSTSVCGDYEQIATVVDKSNTFLDSEVEKDRLYYYKIKAQFEDNSSSDFSRTIMSISSDK